MRYGWTNGRTDGQTNKDSYRVAYPQLKRQYRTGSGYVQPMRSFGEQVILIKLIGVDEFKNLNHQAFTVDLLN